MPGRAGREYGKERERDFFLLFFSVRSEINLSVQSRRRYVKTGSGVKRARARGPRRECGRRAVINRTESNWVPKIYITCSTRFRIPVRARSRGHGALGTCGETGSGRHLSVGTRGGAREIYRRPRARRPAATP